MACVFIISLPILLCLAVVPAQALERDFDLPGGGSVRMVYSAAGSFLMGNNGREPCVYPDELPRHEVYLSGFWIGKLEVTRGQYRRFIDAGGYSNEGCWSKEGWAWKAGRKQPGMWEPKQTWLPPLEFAQTDDYPVVGVSYHEAEAFCNWAGLSLPTEAQWEKTARWDGLRARTFPWGDKWEPDKCNNWYDTLHTGFQSAPAGSYPAGASPYGAMDMAGNAWEWCKDWYGPDYYNRTPRGGWIDPQGPPQGMCRSMRGGSWFSFDYNTRCAYRGNFFFPGNWYYEYGFRVVRSDIEGAEAPKLSAKPLRLSEPPILPRADRKAAKLGAGAYKGRDPIGGGPGYSRTIDPATASRVVSTLDEFKKALTAAKPGDIIYLADGAEIDATGEKTALVAPEGVTIAGSRGRGRSAGPVVFTNNLDCYSMLCTGGPNVRITGIRIQGADTRIRATGDDVLHNAMGVMVGHPNAELDNCEVLGWSAAGIEFSDAGPGSVRHCYIHHNRRAGNGYGVYVHASQIQIEANHFAENRHDVAGSGRAGSSYWARYNISEANEPFTSHAFDMHGNQDSRARGEIVPNICGDTILIERNTFRSCRPRIYIAIRGRPRVSLTIRGNVYENAFIGGMLLKPCSNAAISGDHFPVPAKRAYYSFDSDGNCVNGRRVRAGEVRSLSIPRSAAQDSP